jgi:hypothetical protein
LRHAQKGIPDDIKQQADAIVDHFNQTVIKHPLQYYLTRYKGMFLYLDRADYGRRGAICRLTYTGTLDQWEFAIFKYSSDSYDPAEWFFPGSDYVDGTIEGAMKAGLAAYPS